MTTKHLLNIFSKTNRLDTSIISLRYNCELNTCAFVLYNCKYSEGRNKNQMVDIEWISRKGYYRVNDVQI